MLQEVLISTLRGGVGKDSRGFLELVGFYRVVEEVRQTGHVEEEGYMQEAASRRG